MGYHVVERQVYCPNCGHKITGYETDDGYAKITCKYCKCFVVSKRHMHKVVIQCYEPKTEYENV